MNLIGPMIIELHDRRNEAVLIADRDLDLICVFERQPDGQSLYQLPFPDRLTPEQALPENVTETFKSILHDHGWRERVLDEAEQRQMLLNALLDISVHFLELKARIVQVNPELTARAYPGKVH